MAHLCEKDNWSDSIRTLAEALLDKGLIEKGLKGKLYARLILVLAHDWLREKAPQPKSNLKFKPTFTVQEFLVALYNEDHHQSILKIPPQILRAKMNFTHFVPADENLYAKVIPELSHDLLRRSAALQLAHGQPTYDIMIPIYFDDSEKQFKVSQCGAILIQVKNKQVAMTVHDIFKETFTKVSPKSSSESTTIADDKSIRNGEYFVFNNIPNPMLFLLFDLGVARNAESTSPPVQVSCSTSKRKPDIWAIHSCGHDNQVFGCLKRMGCETNSEKFFISTMLKKSIHDNLCQRNKIFRELRRGFKYFNSSR